MEVIEDIVIVGAGVAGLATALGLHRKGVRSVVLESSDVLRAWGYASSTWTNAWRALDELGVGDTIRQHHNLLQGVILSTATGAIVTSDLSSKKQENQGKEVEDRCVRRNIMIEALERALPSGTIRYSSKIVAIEEDGNIKILHLSDGSIIKTKVLIGCDGVNSVVAKWLGLKKPDYFGVSAARGLVEFSSGHDLKQNFNLFFREGYRLGLLPCSEKTVYWFFLWSPSPEEKDVEKSATKMRQYILNKLENVPKEVKQIIEMTEFGKVVSTPLRYRSPFSLLWGNISKGNVCVAGDALHPMTPYLGQGACLALEDGVILAKYLSEAILEDHKGAQEEYDRINQALDKYARARRWRSIQLIATAYVAGRIQQNDGMVIKFLRENFLSRWIHMTSMKISDYDCRKL